MQGKKEVFWQVITAFSLVGIVYIGSYALLSNYKISSKLESVEDQLGVIGTSVGYQAANVQAAGVCSSINYGRIASNNEAELQKLAQALYVLEESGLGWFLPYNPVTGTVRSDNPMRITSAAHLGDPLFRIKYHHGIIPEGGAWVGTRYVDAKTIAKINELLCSPKEQIVFSNPYSLGSTPQASDPVPVYQQKGLLDFRWNYYKIDPETIVKITVENNSTNEKTVIADNISLATKIYNWEIPADFEPGMYRAYIECVGNTKCSDKNMGLFEIKSTPQVTCTIINGYIDMTQNPKSRWFNLYREYNSCSTAGLGQGGYRGQKAQFCKNYHDDLVALKSALISLPESQYYSGQKNFDAIRAFAVNTRKAVQNFQLYHGIYTSGDAKFGFPDTLTRTKIRQITCAQ